MKQKYTIRKDENNAKLTIQEFAELDKDLFSLVCEESYDEPKIDSAIREGKGPLISVLRTPNMYPIAEYADKIADSVIGLYQPDQEEAVVEIVFDDVQMLKKGNGIIPSEEEDMEIDTLLDEDQDEDEDEDVDEDEDEDVLDIDEDLEDEKDELEDDLDDEQPFDSLDEDEED